MVDGFGNPLNDVEVTVSMTTFKATSNSVGKYTVGFVPGKVRVGYKKEGYTARALSLDIATESRFPAENVVMWRIPTVLGVYLLSDAEYLPLAKAALSRRVDPTRVNEIVKGELYYFTVNGPTTEVKSNRLRILNAVPQAECSILKVGDDGFIGQIQDVPYFPTYVYPKAAITSLTIKLLNDSPRLSLLEGSMANGRYVYTCFKEQGVAGIC